MTYPAEAISGPVMYETDIKKHVRMLRNHRLLILASVVLCAAAAAAYAWTREEQYSAHTQLFVSTTAAGDVSPSQIYEGGLASQSRAETYATLITSRPVVTSVIDQLGLSKSVQDIQGEITATAPTDTALINVTVQDPSPKRATDIANALVKEFPRFVSSLESTDSGQTTAPIAVSVTSPPELPTSPSSPSKALILAVGVVVGVLLGVGAAVIRELLDRRVRDDGAAEAIARAPVLARIPRDPRVEKRPLVVAADPDSPEAEAYRRLRTNLRVALIDRRRHSLLVTSAVAGEGKTLISANLAVAFAHAGHEVVLVDADMRRPGVADLLELEQAPGLSEILASDPPDDASLTGELGDILHREQRFPLQVLTGGAPPQNPSELLESPAFDLVLRALSRRAELVILDSPALLAVGDAAVIGRLASAVLMVTRVSTRVEHLELAIESLSAVGAQPIGAVLNAVPGIKGSAHVYGPRAEVDAALVPVWKRQARRAPGSATAR